MIKVSIIVPVYNVEKYLAQCLDSILKQTLQEIEIIVVNDGSTDASETIMEQYAKQSKKISIYKKENGGLSDARNYGLRYCTGEYIGFVDSDDFIEPDMYEKLYEKAKQDNSDIVECNLFHTYPDTEDIEIGEKLENKHDMIMFGRSIVWNKIYRREWLETTGITFHKNLIYEDVEFYIKLVPHIQVYSYIDPPLIHYVQRNSSINNFSTKKTMHIIEILQSILEYYSKFGFKEEYNTALEFLFIRILLCSSFLRMCKIQDKQDRKLALKKNWELLNVTFPNWKKNEVLQKRKVKHKLFIKTINSVTYRLYGWMLSNIYHIKGSRK